MKFSLAPHRVLVLVNLLLLSVVGCSSSESGTAEEPLLPALQAAVDSTIIPKTQAFAEQAATLQTESMEFCDALTESALTALQDRWLTLAPEWNEAMVYNLGPLDDNALLPSMNFIESKRIRGTDYTSDVRLAIEAAVDGTDPLDAEYFASLTFTEVGVLALEVLLFEDGNMSNETEDILNGYTESPRRCEYLGGIATLLADRADRVESGWTEDYNDTGVPYRELLLTGMLEDGSESVPAVINATWMHVEYIRVRKLQATPDARAATAARPDESPFWANLASGLDSVEDVMDPPGADASFYSVMESRGFSQNVAAVQQSIEEARVAVAGEDRDVAAAAFLDLETRLRREVPEGLGVRLGFGFTDGD